MRRLESLLLACDLVTFFVIVVPLRPRLRWVRQVALAVLPLAIVQGLVEGPRWQMVPAYALAATFFLVWLFTTAGSPRRPGGRTWIRHAGSPLTVSLGVVVLAMAGFVPWALPVFGFPHPRGPYRIGTVTYHWVDAGRHEVFSADATARRELMVQLWYPSKGVTSSRRASYLPDADALGPSWARLTHLPAFTVSHFRYVTTNAVPSAPLTDDRPRYPVLIYLTGLDGFRQLSTFQIEELVSQGYIVAGLDQPYTAAAVVFPDGRRVAGASRAQMRGLIERPDRVRALIEQSVHPVNPAPTLHGRPFPDGVIPFLAQDVVFTLNRLAALDRADPEGILTGRLDLRHAGTFGVSLGGIVAGEACHRDARLRACLVMDAPMTADVVEAGLSQPTMWITRDADTMRLERRSSGGWSEAEIAQHQTTMRAVFRSLPGDGYFVRVPGMFHVNLTDVPYWSPLLSRFGVIGPIDPHRAHDIVNAYSLAFFDRHLKGRPAALLDGPTDRLPGVLVEIRHRRNDPAVRSATLLALPTPLHTSSARGRYVSVQVQSYSPIRRRL